ncbi:class I SAM-dependent methyltransferase [Algoriphagus sp. NG3]|uniref:class I SAM-dependent methyltransferase n=1 Tax=Algoriphagus sp. NG3 TaxID=3097546 RepID=UPI002A80B2FE|nr:class I SAM-dependent methyltransferase [Algoriphagus sp. NG3]WPR74905.1 class I SAM-dependent methyltransferase [Algoriphagus sp. NG3]
MLEKLKRCPLCKSGLFLNTLEIKDHAVSKETFIVCRCQTCGLKFTNPRPSEEAIVPYYDFPEYFSHDDNTKNLTQFLYHQIRKVAITGKVKLLNDLKSAKGKYLDYGCGTAELLVKAQKAGWEVAGIEPNAKARNLANSKLEGKVFDSLGNLPQVNYDIITLYHVAEHIHELRKTIKILIKHLKSDGYILIAVPNPDSYDALKYGKYWAGWDVPRHLYHFNQQAMSNFAEIFDLQLLDKKPMKFDSYYVSLLSEGYKNPNQKIPLKYWRALLTGSKSNRKASQAEENYSSNLFVFKKK